MLPPLHSSRVWSLSWPWWHLLRRVLATLISLREGDLMSVSPLGRAQAAGWAGLMLPAGSPCMGKELWRLGGSLLGGQGVPSSSVPEPCKAWSPRTQ